MKQLDKLVIKSFVAPYIFAFFIAEFVLLMQFLWKYIDEILGKGFSMGVLMELLFYFGVTIVPMAIPISILISSVMVFGNMAEKFEMSSLKSSGVSLMRIMAGGILIAILTAMFSLFASNYLKPKANYKFLERFNSVRRQKPALTIEKQIFNKDFQGFAIRVGDKGKDGKSIYDIYIADHTDNDKSLIREVVASHGKMYSDDETGSFIMQLHDGEQYREIKPKKTKDNAHVNSRPFMRTKFKSWKKVFDMSQFDMDAQSINLSRKKFDLLNAFQLNAAIDTIAMEREDLVSKNFIDYNGIISLASLEENSIAFNVDKNENDSPKAKALKDKQKEKKGTRAFVRKDTFDMRASLYESFDSVTQSKLYLALDTKLSSDSDKLKVMIDKDQSLYKNWSYHQLRMHQQFSWAMICIIFLFIGGPFGSIVRKGGYGYPLLIAIIFFVLFIIFNIAGEKLNKSMSIHPVLAAWLPCLVLTPFAIWFTWKALNDRAMNISLPSWMNFKKSG